MKTRKAFEAYMVKTGKNSYVVYSWDNYAKIYCQGIMSYNYNTARRIVSATNKCTDKDGNFDGEKYYDIMYR